MLKISPAVRRLLARKCRFRNIKQRSAKEFYNQLPKAQALALSNKVLEDLDKADFVIDVESIVEADEELAQSFLEVLEVEQNGMPAGTKTRVIK
uniref:Uncharacterized protein n=1 Tax=Moniliophthora roreri TaxID=221103 RepID=A0A0W0FS58_MONRR